MSKTILKPKLFAPTLRKNIVKRARLLDQINRGVAAGHKLTVVSAPAGFGKTTLASDWLTQCGKPYAWLSLDSDDAELSSFLNYLTAALQTIEPSLGKSVTAMLHSGQTSEAILTELINEISSLSIQFVVALDDYHLTASKELDAVLQFLLTHLPTQMHLLIVSRQELEIPIARLRVLNQVTEIGAKDLLLNLDETEIFLQSTMGLALPQPIIEQLKLRTEGWIAGLQLAAISIPEQDNLDQFVKSLSGANQFVFDFLFDEVLLQQPEHIQDFFVSTANLKRMSSALCDAVLLNASLDAREILDYLQRVNLFLVPLDDERTWFRYHHLFHDSLRQLQARRLDKQAINLLHWRASIWFESHGELGEAFHSAMAGQHVERAAQIAERSWENLSQNFQSKTWMAWIKQLPESIIVQRPVLCVQIAWSLMDAGSFDLSEDRLRDAERSMQNLAEKPVIEVAEQFHNLSARIAFVRAYNAQNRGDVSATIRYAELVLHLSPIEENHFIRAQARAILAALYWARGDLDQAYQSLAEWVEHARRSGNMFFAIAGASGKALVLWNQGHLADAQAIYQQALKDASTLEGGGQQIISHLFLGIALIHLELGNDEMANDFLLQSEEAGKYSTLPDWLYRYHIALARFSESQGDLETALTQLDEAQRHFVATLVPDSHPVEALKAAIYIKQGALQRAHAWLRKAQLMIDDAPVYLREFEYMTMIRLMLADWQVQPKDGERNAMLGLLDRLLAMAEQQNRLRSVLDLLKLKAQIYYANGQQAEAFDLLESLLARAKPEGYLRFFVDDGQAVHGMLVAFRSKLSENTKLRGLYAAHLDKVLSTFAQHFTMPQESILDPLSQRELAVLKLIAQGHSNEEICAQLFLALDTVKGHNRRIFNKLQVRRRTEAVIRAQKLGLL